MTPCLTCQLLIARDSGTRPLWDAIHRTPNWDVVHCNNTSLPGWLVLVARRHIEAVADLTDTESIELGQLERRVSLALHAATGCAKTYIVQFAEHPQHPHVHFHVIPRMAGMPDEARGPGIFRYLGVSEAEQVSEARMNEIGRVVQRALREVPQSAV